VLPEDVVLPRVPAAAIIRFRLVCWAWRATLTSDHFADAHRAVRAAGSRQPSAGDRLLRALRLWLQHYYGLLLVQA